MGALPSKLASKGHSPMGNDCCHSRQPDISAAPSRMTSRRLASH